MSLLKIVWESLTIVVAFVMIICGAFMMNNEPAFIGGYIIFFEGIIWAFINIFEVLYVIYNNVENKNLENESKEEKKI